MARDVCWLCYSPHGTHDPYTHTQPRHSELCRSNNMPVAEFATKWAAHWADVGWCTLFGELRCGEGSLVMHTMRLCCSRFDAHDAWSQFEAINSRFDLYTTYDCDDFRVATVKAGSWSVYCEWTQRTLAFTILSAIMVSLLVVYSSWSL